MNYAINTYRRIQMSKNLVPRPQYGGMTLNEVAEALGLSRQRVKQIEQNALRKIKFYMLRKYMKNKDLYSFDFDEERWNNSYLG